MKERTTDEWLKLFRELEIPAAPLNTPDALFDNEHLNAVGLFETVDTPTVQLAGMSFLTKRVAHLLSSGANSPLSPA